MVDTVVILLNWNNAADTIACMDSMLSFPDLKIVIVDNHSTDDSLLLISNHLVSKSVSSATVDDHQLPNLMLPDTTVLIIKSPVNSGFAGGNNLALRQALNWPSIRYTWLLNNDAIPHPDALGELKQTIEENEDTAFAGSVVLDYQDRDKVQCCGVRYYPWLGISKLLLKNRQWSSVRPGDIPYSRIDFQMGASILVKLSAIKEIGLMDEQFFLYFEEQDWQYTAADMGYINVLAPHSLVYHKGSASTSNKKHLFFYYYNRSAVIFARKHSSMFLSLIATKMLIGILLVRSKLYYKSVCWGLKGIREGWSRL